MELARHGTLKLSMRYAHADETEKRNAVIWVMEDGFGCSWPPQ